ncbi:hypothetical protein C8Q77DRAFT_1117378 [Trametes polyzona]|nr:hypothetical protein C8Q77DRAFT_1117378 [Trametes polyzona]
MATRRAGRRTFGTAICKTSRRPLYQVGHVPDLPLSLLAIVLWHRAPVRSQIAVPCRRRYLPCCQYHSARAPTACSGLLSPEDPSQRCTASTASKMVSRPPCHVPRVSRALFCTRPSRSADNDEYALTRPSQLGERHVPAVPSLPPWCADGGCGQLQPSTLSRRTADDPAHGHRCTRKIGSTAPHRWVPQGWRTSAAIPRTSRATHQYILRSSHRAATRHHQHILGIASQAATRFSVAAWFLECDSPHIAMYRLRLQQACKHGTTVLIFDEEDSG